MPNLEKISLVSLKKQAASARMLMYYKKIQFVAYFVFTYNSCVGKPLVSGILQLILIILNRKAEAEFMKKLFGGIFHKKDETQLVLLLIMSLQHRVLRKSVIKKIHWLVC